MLMQLQSISQPILERSREPIILLLRALRYLWLLCGRKNNLNTYDIRYQKFDDQGNKHGERIISLSPDSNSV